MEYYRAFYVLTAPNIGGIARPFRPASPWAPSCLRRSSPSKMGRMKTLSFHPPCAKRGEDEDAAATFP
jgi:hypothetical protein